MKIIDLLNKIANGEEVPNKFKLKGFKTDLVFCYNEKYNCYDLIGEKFKNDCYVFGYSELNDEIEILEEEPRDIEVCGSLFTKSEYDKLAHCEEEKKIPEKLEDISEIKFVGCKVEIDIIGNKTLFDTNTPIVTEHCIYKINQLIKNQKIIIDYLKSKGE